MTHIETKDCGPWNYLFKLWSMGWEAHIAEQEYWMMAPTSGESRPKTGEQG